MQTKSVNTQQHPTAAFRALAERVDAFLDKTLLGSTHLSEAMRYSVLNGGKRLRPLLVYTTGAAFNVELAELDACAAAVELIHAYSLIHDDLPSMDDDALRRGKPTCHKAFDEATAILAGDALQSLAFEVLTEASNLSAQTQVDMLRMLAQATGKKGLAGGQDLDLVAVGKIPDLQALEHIYRLKTGTLIQASIALGALAGAATARQMETLNQFALHLGLAFQIQDDILDIEGDERTTGKQSGSDSNHDKPTYPTLTGLNQAKLKVTQLYQDALDCLTSLDLNTELLVALTRTIIYRDY